MEAFSETLIRYSQWIIFLVLLGVGYFAGSQAEKNHFASLQAREQEFLSLPAGSLRLPPADREIESVWLVTGSAVIAVDYFKVFIANLRNFFGGRLSSYESLVDRARREATLRMKDAARSGGADLIVNLRIEIANLGAEGAPGLPTVESLAFGTAIRYRK
ncbi:MAG: hypothetical protein CVV27_12680 [Candidatus Melainabacteria bacterium HGW-Melainabacteria-1]|nr:MAG: hypothetical protein CVV27_12680 [Candidatus Melainabacteria bacterium HGW-Melainabacteria-1]